MKDSICIENRMCAEDILRTAELTYNKMDDNGSCNLYLKVQDSVFVTKH